MKSTKGFAAASFYHQPKYRVPSGVSPDFSKPIRILSDKKVNTLEGEARQFLLLQGLVFKMAQ